MFGGLNAIVLVSFSLCFWKYAHAGLWDYVFMHTFGIVRMKSNNVVVMYVHVYFGGELVKLTFGGKKYVSCHRDFW